MRWRSIQNPSNVLDLTTRCHTPEEANKPQTTLREWRTLCVAAKGPRPGAFNSFQKEVSCDASHSG